MAELGSITMLSIGGGQSDVIDFGGTLRGYFKSTNDTT